MPPSGWVCGRERAALTHGKATAGKRWASRRSDAITGVCIRFKATHRSAVPVGRAAAPSPSLPMNLPADSGTAADGIRRQAASAVVFESAGKRAGSGEQIAKPGGSWNLSRRTRHPLPTSRGTFHRCASPTDKHPQPRPPLRPRPGRFGEELSVPNWRKVCLLRVKAKLCL